MQILNTLFGFKIVHGMVLCIVFQLYRQRQSAQISVKLGNNSILSKNLFFCGLKKICIRQNWLMVLKVAALILI